MLVLPPPKTLSYFQCPVTVPTLASVLSPDTWNINFSSALASRLGHCTAHHKTSQQRNEVHCTALHKMYCTGLHRTSLHSNILHYSLYCSSQNSIALHYTLHWLPSHHLACQKGAQKRTAHCTAGITAHFRVHYIALHTVFLTVH